MVGKVFLEPQSFALRDSMSQKDLLTEVTKMKKRSPGQCGSVG